jgi:phosphoribosylformimino-5-aminoimidazole carboxamide ribotide isomerase
MRFRPCIDIHNGKVKQIVGGSLTDQNDGVRENFVSQKPAAYYAELYKKAGLFGGHIILLDKPETSYYKEDKKEAEAALAAYPNGLQIGGGINADNGGEFIKAGASHVIVTSYVFRDGSISYENLENISRAVGREHLVLDLSCRKKDGDYYVVTDRWQKFTKEKLSVELLSKLSLWCDEFLIHAVDVEGKSTGIENRVLKLLSGWSERPVTYAGGIHSIADIEKIGEIGKNNVDFTVGTGLDLFGGTLDFQALSERFGK